MDSIRNSDPATYARVHRWIKKERGKANHCEFCNKPGGLFEWSNKSGRYLFELSDWQQLCRQCHAKFDKPSPEEQAVRLAKHKAARVRNKKTMENIRSHLTLQKLREDINTGLLD